MCKPNPCKNFGVCSQVEHDYECTCSRGFIGKNCDSKWELLNSHVLRVEIVYFHC